MQLLTMPNMEGKGSSICHQEHTLACRLNVHISKAAKKPHISFDEIMASGTVIDSVEQKEWGVAPELSSPLVKQSSHMWNFNGSYRCGAGH